MIILFQRDPYYR